MADRIATMARFMDKLLGCDPEEVKEEARLVEDLGADSLDLIEIQMALEDEFGIDIGLDPSPITMDSTVGDLIRIVDKLSPPRAPAPEGRAYLGRRTPAGCKVGFVDPADKGAQIVALEPRLDLENKSPSGFEWGYEGSGPAQLAIALVADATGDDQLARRVYQQFKREIVAKLPPDEWQLGAGEIAKFAALLRPAEDAR